MGQLNLENIGKDEIKKVIVKLGAKHWNYISRKVRKGRRLKEKTTISSVIRSALDALYLQDKQK